MKRSSKFFGGILLIFIGLNILLGMIGVNIGGIIGLLVGGALLYWGYSKWQDKGQWSFSSIILVTFGALMLLGGLGGIVSLLIGAFLVYGGYKLMKTKESVSDDHEDVKEKTKAHSIQSIKNFRS
ncbi:hypothetical protein [Halalkalibacter okhensis]|uniref:LiaF transmembrane domain-containing protein n=1 Tax=Halalkalibacter okhensis TaxID=333138 RepID=A0A0B0IMD0_9BACI|nr:hypothetical protein [Halalkalibacter okhensis]KHF42037.1 hypothetical protein LQ50_01765 [Halalkalibacter okhensis]